MHVLALYINKTHQQNLAITETAGGFALDGAGVSAVTELKSFLLVNNCDTFLLNGRYDSTSSMGAGEISRRFVS